MNKNEKIIYLQNKLGWDIDGILIKYSKCKVNEVNEMKKMRKKLRKMLFLELRVKQLTDHTQSRSFIEQFR